MARIRTVKPSIHEDQKVARVSGFAMVLWVGLWQHSDDKTGVCPGDVRLLKNKIFPLRDFTLEYVTSLVLELEAEGLVRAFVCRRELYIQTPNFRKHQSISKPQENKYPDPRSEEVSWVKYGNIPDLFREPSGSLPGKAQEDSGREEEEEEEREEEGEDPEPGDKSPAPPVKKRRPPVSEQEEELEEYIRQRVRENSPKTVLRDPWPKGTVFALRDLSKAGAELAHLKALVDWSWTHKRYWAGKIKSAANLLHFLTDLSHDYDKAHRGRPPYSAQAPPARSAAEVDADIVKRAQAAEEAVRKAKEATGGES